MSGLISPSSQTGVLHLPTPHACSNTSLAATRSHTSGSSSGLLRLTVEFWYFTLTTLRGDRCSQGCRRYSASDSVRPAFASDCKRRTPAFTTATVPRSHRGCICSRFHKLSFDRLSKRMAAELSISHRWGSTRCAFVLFCSQSLIGGTVG